VRVARGLVAAASLFAAGCLAVFGTWLTAAFVAIPALAVWRERPWWGLLGALAVVPAPAEYQLRVRVLAEHRAHLSTREAAGVWLLNLGMAAGGTLAGFPEVALETALLVFPDEDGVRTFRSAFPRGSYRVAAVVDTWAAACRGGRTRFGPAHLPLGYEGGHAEWRRSLALSPVTLRGTASSDCTLTIEATVPVDYPDRAFLVLAPTPWGPLGIDEGLFDALEDTGWLFPYEARWVWTEPPPGR